MNTLRRNTRLFRLFLPAILLTATVSFGQGFIGQYPFFTWSQGGGQSMFPKPDGSFRVTALSYPDFGTDVQLQWFDADAQGHFTQGDTLTTPNSGSPVYGNDIYLLENGGYLRAYADSNRLQLKRFDANGDSLWSTTREIANVKQAYLISVTANAAGEAFIRGYTWTVDSNSVQDDGLILKFAPDGTLLWERRYTFDLTYVIPTSIIPTPDGGCMFNNWGMDQPGSVNDETIVRYDGNGNLIWVYGPGQARLWPHFKGQIFDRNNAGETYLFAAHYNGPTNPGELRIDKLGADGTLLDTVMLGALFGAGNIEGQLVLATADGGAVIVVQQRLLNSWTNHVAKINADGAVAWQRPLGFLTDAFPTEFYQGRALPDGSFALYAFQGNTLYLIKMAADGRIYPHTLTGTIARDSTFNCLPDAFDPPLEGWTVSVSGNGLTQYGSSNADGQYTIADLDAGAYEVVLTKPSYLWQPCADTVQVQFNGTLPVTDTLDFQVQSLYDCPLMEVDIATPFLRRCMENLFAVHYCNNGNQPASDVSVTVLLDPLIELDSATLPYTQNGSLYTFELGAVAAGECGSFNLYTTTSCAAELGQTLCVEAHIYPDTLCAPTVPNWSGARIEVSAECAGDSVLFQIKNAGTAPMPQALDFIIVDDHVITRQGVFQLPAGGTKEETVPADGSTWRLLADQEPGFPLGPQMPSVGVEACVANPSGTFTTGMLNMFANYSGNPFHDTECRTVIGSWDPNDKQAFPAGVDAAHYIDQNQPIEYLIRFQNTGTDTAFTVVIRDTLSPGLDPASIRPGAASHPYSWRLSGEGILTVVFDPILLPDSNVNEAASHGFVQFRINQRRDNPIGTRIENRAGIYFDFNEPVITNSVFHTVGKDFLAVSVTSPKPLRLRLWPNPAARRVVLELDGLVSPGRRLVLRDLAGRQVGAWPLVSSRQEIQRQGLPAGVYWLELRDERRVLAVGKVVWAE